MFKNVNFINDYKSLPPTYTQLFRPIGKDTFSWPGVIVGMPIIGVWYHCVNQELVQKFLGSKNYLDVQAGALLHGYLKLMVFPAVLLVGVYGYLYCGDNIKSDIVYLVLIESVIPPMLQGLVLIAFLSSTIIALSASLNACSTILHFTFIKKYILMPMTLY